MPRLIVDENPYLESFLIELKERGLVDALIEYSPRQFSLAERRGMVSETPEGLEGSIETIGPQFFNELQKREIGRQYMLDQKCTHFLLMDCDEFYFNQELESAKDFIFREKIDSSFCRMRVFLKEPIFEYFPYDNYNAVVFICRLSSDLPLLLAAPISNLMADPTRRIKSVGNYSFFFDRGSVEMYHYSFVRKNMHRKCISVSNRQNYTNANSFLEKLATWKSSDGPIHPHEIIGQIFSEIVTIPNHFEIDISAQCALCARRATADCRLCENQKVKHCQMHPCSKSKSNKKK